MAAFKIILEVFMEKIPSILSGVSGEYFVAAELSRRGYIASLTLKNTKGIDVLVSNAEATKFIGIQVKTNQSARKAWLLNEKNEKYYADNLFYVFVNLKNIDSFPDFYIVPSKTVAHHLKSSFRKWLDTPGKKGQPHKDNPMRMFKEEKDEYLGKWELLNL